RHRLAFETVDHVIDGVGLIGLDLEFEFHIRPQIALTSVVGESWRKICSTLIFTASETKPLSRNTTRRGSCLASSFTRSSVMSLSKQATRALSSTKNTVLP